jgi:hypothetical protein
MMNGRFWILPLLLILATAVIAPAATSARDLQQRRPAIDGHGPPLRGRPVASGGAAAKADTVYLLGGPGRLDGTFQAANGAPDWHGWTSHDITQPVTSHWHIDTFNCAGLDPTEPENHAWWCGDIFAACSPEDPPEGYGNLWVDQLDWYGTVADPALDVTVRVRAMLNYDTEPDYDYLYLEHGEISGFNTVALFTGSNREDGGDFIPVTVDETFTLTPADYVGVSLNQVHLRWKFRSDWFWSDADCMLYGFSTSGAAQIDLIEVFFDQGGGEVQIGTTETCEAGDPVQWTPTLPTGCGDFAQIWTSLHDIDPCAENLSPQVAFIDDGLVVPGTGGYTCTTWCYGPSGYIVNPEGGLRGPDFELWNEVWSPVLQWPGDAYVGATYACDVYLHDNRTSTSPGMSFNMQIRSSNDPTGESGWTDWYNDMEGTFWGGPYYEREVRDFTGRILDDRTFVQLALGVIELYWTGDGTDGTPAPYIDNVSFKVYTYSGPLLEVQWVLDLAQDNFPEIGAIDYVNLGANHVRFDAAYWEGYPSPEPSDRLWFRAVPMRKGAVLNDRPRMYYKLKPNPLFDPYRTSGLPNAGFVYADSASMAYAWRVELPDTGFFYPGDVIHYYFEAQDNVGGDIGTTRLPADTTGFSAFPGDEGYVPMLYPPDFVVRALPSLRAADPDSQPDILLWYDRWENSDRQDEGSWITALANLGFQEGVDYDLYWDTGRGKGNSIGLGGHATATQLANYETLIYTSGTDAVHTMTDNWNTDMDVNCLNNWLLWGNKNMFLTGDGFLYDMINNGSASCVEFVNNWLSVSYLQQDVRPLIDNQTAALVEAIPGNPVFYGVNEWLAYGGCPDVNSFDAVVPVGNAISLAEFTDPSGQAGAYPYAAAVYHHHADYDVNVVYLPYDFNFIMTPQGGSEKPASPSATRTRLLEEVLLSFGHLGSGPVTGLPEIDRFSIMSYPNPFNPITKITYHMPRRGELAIKIYNLRGELVRTLIDEVVTAGDGSLLWDGTDGHGQAVASGVYFYETRTLGRIHVNKIALIK